MLKIRLEGQENLVYRYLDQLAQGQEIEAEIIPSQDQAGVVVAKVELDNSTDDAPDLTAYKPKRELDAADMLKITRAGLGLSQSRAARLLNVPLGTLQGWEQRRFVPDGASQALIRLIYNHPQEISVMLENIIHGTPH